MGLYGLRLVYNAFLVQEQVVGKTKAPWHELLAIWYGNNNSGWRYYNEPWLQLSYNFCSLILYQSLIGQGNCRFIDDTDRHLLLLRQP